MKKTNLIYSLLRGIFFAVGFTVIGVALLALLAKDTEGDFLKIITLAVKVISIILGVITASIKIRKRGAMIGGIVAFIYWIVCVLLSMLVEPLSITLKMFGDLLFTCLMGCLAGILTVNALK